MFMAALILMVTTGLFFFYLQVICQKFLRRRLTQEFYQVIVNANRFEFPSVRRAMEDVGSSSGRSSGGTTIRGSKSS